MKLDMQFLDHHSKQFLDLQAKLIKIDYSQQEEATLTISTHSCCSKSPYCSRTLIGPFLRLSRLDFRIAQFSVLQPQLTMTTIPAKSNPRGQRLPPRPRRGCGWSGYGEASLEKLMDAEIDL